MAWSLNFHLRQGVLRETLDENVGGAIAHFFNCLVGPELTKPAVEESTKPSGKSETKTTSVSDCTISQLLICLHAKMKFMFINTNKPSMIQSSSIKKLHIE